VTRPASELALEANQGGEIVNGIAVDDTHVFWTYDRGASALVFSRKKRTF
jgi:hypothetical protein